MSTQSDSEVFKLTEEYKALEAEWHEHKANFDFLVETYQDENGAVGPDAMVEIIVLNPGRVRRTKLYVEAVLSSLQIRMNAIDYRKVELDTQIIYANDAVTYP
ncbi:hypothetical protein Erwinia_phage_Fougasse_00058 [Erwinia phage Fougasse]|nr:hypothetical protein Erwinia_phage_Calisson_00047 [Erwinia phage Calisson]WJN63959.1 hypothetical protein Erwinia_phage_Farigoule_00072 [Erwinia phage Farigoule]WJN64021.1 hypothetical protein Erwinia_phage_Fougasse_00058 [Erwinia phage Fougasse]WJN64254.1 hypothetical protein Erwinia_phage_Nougat_00058 [Erwinia phage Nougat]WJN64349.1 hypothetical protein Erwinia_phage_Orgeat_00074 [Erwinia phage Orgeat]